MYGVCRTRLGSGSVGPGSGSLRPEGGLYVAL